MKCPKCDSSDIEKYGAYATSNVDPNIITYDGGNIIIDVSQMRNEITEFCKCGKCGEFFEVSI